MVQCTGGWASCAHHRWTCRSAHWGGSLAGRGRAAPWTRPCWPRSCRRSCGSRRWRAAAARATPTRRAPHPRAPRRPAAPRGTCFHMTGERLGPNCAPMLRAAQNADSSVPPWCACLGRRKLLSQDLHSIVRKKDSSLKHLSWAVLVSGYLLHGAAGANSGTSHLLETVAHKGAHAAGRSGGRAGAVSGLCVARRGVLRPPVPAVPSAAAARTVGAVSHTAPQQSSLVYIAAPHTSSQVTGYIAFQPQRPEQKLGDCHHGISHRRQVEHFFACLCLWSFAATNVLACHVATVSQRSTKYRTPALKVTCSAPPCQQTGAAPAGAARDAGPPRADGPAGARRGLLRVLDRVDVARAALAAASASPPPSGAAAPSCTYSLVPHCTPAPGRLHSVTLAGSQESAATLAAAWGNVAEALAVTPGCAVLISGCQRSAVLPEGAQEGMLIVQGSLEGAHWQPAGCRARSPRHSGASSLQSRRCCRAPARPARGAAWPCSGPGRPARTQRAGRGAH